VYHCVQLSYTTQHRTVLIVFVLSSRQSSLLRRSLLEGSVVYNLSMPRRPSRHQLSNTLTAPRHLLTYVPLHRLWCWNQYNYSAAKMLPRLVWSCEWDCSYTLGAGCWCPPQQWSCSLKTMTPASPTTSQLMFHRQQHRPSSYSLPEFVQPTIQCHCHQTLPLFNALTLLSVRQEVQPDFKDDMQWFFGC